MTTPDIRSADLVARPARITPSRECLLQTKRLTSQKIGRGEAVRSPLLTLISIIVSGGYYRVNRRRLGAGEWNSVKEPCMPRVISRLLAAGIAAAIVGLAGAAAAQTFPSRPIRLIVTFPPGGSTDTMARTLQPSLERSLGQPIVIENRPGAGGAIGVEAVVKAAPDGYVIGIAGLGALAVDVILNDKLPYDPFKDIAPISGLIQSPFILAAPLSFPGNSIADVIAIAKAKPATLTIGHGGNGTAMQLTAQLFNQMTGLDIPLVPYRGTGPVTTDVLAGHIPLGITDPPSAIAQIEGKRIKALAISSRARFPALPDIPTFAESGLPGYESIGWFGFVAPAGTPPAIIARLNAAIVTALADPGVLERIRLLGAVPMPGTPEEFGRFIRAEYEKWAKVVAESGAKTK
jgi:tripartite-type tricarboxylate transporter receptor subunit TctC